ncbi:MAG TPA: HD-GYP domain-containing protein [Pedococcus sp.]|nr:HD-GYP domain-containing protein [Pedococcus sp.]
MNAEARPRNGGSVRYTSIPTIVTVLLVCALAACLLGLSWHAAGPPHDLFALGVLSLLGIASWMLRETDVGSRVQLSFTSIIMLAAAVVVGPFGAGIVGAVSTLVTLGHEKITVRMFNVGMFTSIATMGALVYSWTRGVPYAAGVTGAGDLLLRVGGPLLCADLAQCLTNALVLALILRVAGGVPMRMQTWKLLSTTGPAYVGYSVIGFLFVVLWIPAQVGWFSAVLVLAPLFVARWAFGQYGDELRAHDRTLRALVTAVETKDPHNAGHSERVAKISEWLAEALGLGHREIQDIRTAGMLHDIGKVGVPTRLLRPRRDLTDSELVLIADHALGGVDLIQGIDFLKDSVDGVAHHHERFDGLGYPGGLTGPAIPLVAQIVAVADVFDCLTTARVYRPAHTTEEAVELMKQRSGTQFDPHIVEALTRVLARHEWVPTQPSDDVLASAGVALDHDEPEVSDLFAERADLRAQLRGATPRVAQSVAGRA